MNYDNASTVRFCLHHEAPATIVAAMNTNTARRNNLFRDFIKSEYGVTVAYDGQRVMLIDGAHVWMRFPDLQSAIDNFRRAIMANKTYAHTALNS